ncbi:CDP-alcohol phosphatidyltransferase family protein [Herbiconiux daphne]|uniref:CDP-alcohol phosphatidyltransferase family protein n=1 Tax=Herbiconiux daphne TaxID=2970914 RepID=A0ABT2H1N7_9MICO|nr:CDP-alcohol phosphatidyltransferase family protein [Herbiconiux daphne]MCS5733827.1 CDP-alcohol phosphatidyltransferase family protein [Herbiconiux daphne]
MNVPNAISFGRLLILTPLFVVVLLVARSPLLALITLIVLGITDWADGFIARRFDQQTDLGKKLDPIADRVSQFVVCATLVVAGLVPLWMALVLLLSDLLLGITILVRKPGIVKVRWLGRFRTVLLMVGFPLLLLVESFWPGHPVASMIALVVVGAGVVLHAVANLQYTYALLRKPSLVS